MRESRRAIPEVMVEPRKVTMLECLGMLLSNSISLSRSSRCASVASSAKMSLTL